ncbi:hypothetical protein [Nonomuraea wenchangensis]|uniref:Uncharacterized protein n=1 Tax=Nonomuraea wenchangensis TaxID=568860 RepID=A0A1I0EYY6_9ACTN|nr:hypothetical protein [Nonomuraea wenchangensis]SET50884.1 hypothetical protein SAMN05421811_103259 [Nonomuraea wenchangensis]
MTVSDHLFNAVHPALRSVGAWLPLSDRQKVAAEIESYLRRHDVLLVDARYLHGREHAAENADRAGEAS